VEQTVYACAVNERLAQPLGIAKGVPAQRVLRQYRDAARALVVATQSFYPEGRYSLATTWVRAG
jgi:GntR family transcriptional regulator